MNMGEEVSHLKAHVNTFYNNGALQRASEQPHLKTNQKPSQINKKVGSQEMRVSVAAEIVKPQLIAHDKKYVLGQASCLCLWSDVEIMGCVLSGILRNL
ncbi:hypothetical protein [Ruegeria sp.]|uniref:hypothetical protein n=1 Tax=Ruegeria sp. TaxID=1879320 RepID=UPI003B0072F9